MRRPIEQNKFAVYRQDVNKENYFNKLVDEQAYFEARPSTVDYEMLEPTKRRIASYAKGNIIGADGTLMKVFEENARVLKTTARTLQWRLYTNDGDVRATFIKNYEVGEKEPGKNSGVFEIGLDVDWFGPNDVIIFEGLREIPLLIRSHPEPDGQSYVYEVVLHDNNPRGFFPIEYLQTGTRILQIGSLIPEATVERGNIHFTDGEAFVEFEIPMTRMGWQMKVTDEAYMAASHFKIKEKCTDGSVDNTSPGILYNTLDMKFERAVNRQKDLWLTYGRSTGKFSGKFLDGLTERDIKSGPGLYEYLESSYSFDFDPENDNIDIFRKFLPSLWNDKVDPADRDVTIYTGTGGLILWDKWCREADIEGVVQTEEWNYTKETPRTAGRIGVGINAKEYVVYHIHPFGKITVKYMPFLDSETIDTRRYEGLPFSSYEFFIFNFGYGEGDASNINIVENDAYKNVGYMCGNFTPMGFRGGSSQAPMRFAYSQNPAENAFYYKYECMIGLVLKDPSYLVHYRPNFA